MAITLSNKYKLSTASNDEGSYALETNYVLDLRTGKSSESSTIVLYGPSDIKKLARAKKITYVQALSYFIEVGIDDHTGAAVYVAKI